uniref:C2H2-type domain-containing protein n=1 Tax=Kalanchoe fedtschenkoi TaxID=63787 RepID=A0A7N0UAM7_KALFE
MEMDSSRRSFDRSRELGMKKARLGDEANHRDPRILNSGVRGGVRPPSADVLPSRYGQIDREAEADASSGGAYHPTHQLFSELVTEYRKGLAELTVNSKPIITNLTIIAGENVHAAKAIAETICNHIIEVFCKAYKQVGPSIHVGMRHLFRTWERVFPLQPLQVIERELGISLALNSSSSVSARSKPEPQSQYPQKSIHVNPKYLEARQNLQPLSRAKGSTTDISTNVMKPTMNVARLGTQRTEPLRESMYEKDTEDLYGDYDFSLKKIGIGEQDKHWYTGTSTADTVMGQRNGYDGKHKLTNYSTPQSHTSRSNGGTSRSWKNSEEEEYLWDDIHSAPRDTRNDNMVFDDSEDVTSLGASLELINEMSYPVATTIHSTQAAEYARVLDVTSAGASSSVGRKTLQSQMIRPSATGAVAKSLTNINATIGQKRPAPPSRQPALHQRSPSPSFSAGHDNSAPSNLADSDFPISQSAQRAGAKSSQIPELDNLRSRAQLKKESSSILPQSSKKPHIDSQKSKLIPSSVQPSLQRGQQHSLSQHSKSGGRLSGPSNQNLKQPVPKAPTFGTADADVVQQSSSSDLLTAVLNSGVLPKRGSNPKPEVDYKEMLDYVHSDVHPPVPGVVTHRQVGSKSPKMSPASVSTSSQDIKSASSVSKMIGAPSQAITGKALSKKAGNENKIAANPFSNLLSTLMEKGLITSSNNEPSTSLMSDEFQDAIPGVISLSLPSMKVSASSSHSSLIGGNNASASEHAAHNSIDNLFNASEIKNLIGFEFKPNLIRQLHEPVIEDLNDGLPYICNVCGLRLKIQERLDRHMEWHSAKEFDNEYGASRRWFSDLDDWVARKLLTAAEPFDSAEEIEEVAIEDERCLVPADESQCICILCGELFEDYYSQEEDKWMFRGAMHVKIPGQGHENITSDNGPARDLIVHTECFTESSAHELGLVATVKAEEYL